MTASFWSPWYPPDQVFGRRQMPLEDEVGDVLAKGDGAAPVKRPVDSGPGLPYRYPSPGGRGGAVGISSDHSACRDRMATRIRQGCVGIGEDAEVQVPEREMISFPPASLQDDLVEAADMDV